MTFLLSSLFWNNKLHFALCVLLGKLLMTVNHLIINSLYSTRWPAGKNTSTAIRSLSQDHTSTSMSHTHRGPHSAVTWAGCWPERWARWARRARWRPGSGGPSPRPPGCCAALAGCTRTYSTRRAVAGTRAGGDIPYFTTYCLPQKFGPKSPRHEAWS